MEIGNNYWEVRVFFFGGGSRCQLRMMNNSPRKGNQRCIVRCVLVMQLQLPHVVRWMWCVDSQFGRFAAHGR